MTQHTTTTCQAGSLKRGDLLACGPVFREVLESREALSVPNIQIIRLSSLDGPNLQTHLPRDLTMTIRQTAPTAGLGESQPFRYPAGTLRDGFATIETSEHFPPSPGGSWHSVVGSLPHEPSSGVFKGAPTRDGFEFERIGDNVQEIIADLWKKVDVARKEVEDLDARLEEVTDQRNELQKLQQSSCLAEDYVYDLRHIGAWSPEGAELIGRARMVELAVNKVVVLFKRGDGANDFVTVEAEAVEADRAEGEGRR